MYEARETVLESINSINPNELPKNELPMQVFIIVLVIVLVIGTAILIRIFWKPSKRN